MTKNHSWRNDLLPITKRLYSPVHISLGKGIQQVPAKELLHRTEHFGMTGASGAKAFCP